MKFKFTPRIIAVLLILMVVYSYFTAGQPTGADITYNATETKSPSPAEYINTSGGTFTTLILSAETQNPRWKAYAGNVTGSFVLDDAADYTIYDWTLSSFTGEVYASRNDTITWSNIECADQAMINLEQTIMSHSSTAEDNINNTFPYTIHSEFYVGTVQIVNSTCRSTATWVNDTAQTIAEDAIFQEMLLSDTVSLIYTTLIYDNTQGFNFNDYDFQMIVAERDLQGNQATPYYFYLELV